MSWESVRSSGKRKMVLWDDRGKEVGGVKNGRESEEDRHERSWTSKVGFALAGDDRPAWWKWVAQNSQPAGPLVPIGFPDSTAAVITA
ncbi:hypothetical protein VTI28DRAFT_7406 [Corynascus sepedonium]